MTKSPITRRTKIVCTMGPACSGEVLPQLLAAGMNVARLNFSHGTREEHAGWIRRIRELSEQLQTPVAILQDLAGPKVRIGELPGGEVTLKDGETFALSAGGVAAARPGASVNYPQIIAETPVGARILLADGNIELRVEAKADQVLHCRVVVGGVLRSRVGINFPDHSLSVPALTAKDYEDLRFGLAQGVDFVALSYVRSAEDVRAAREFIRGQGAETPIIAKIEKHEALAQLEEILAAADGLMVARGDLGVEVPLERVPLLQKQIIAAANRAGKPVITATQMLLSMVDHARPSRAEATDVANAILDGTDAVMLSEETAVGHYPVEAVKFLDQVSRATEESFPYTDWLRSRAAEGRAAIGEAVSHAACEMALDLEAAAILTNTDGGGTARLISRFRPRNPIIALTSRPETWRRLCLSWGVLPLLTPATADIDEMLEAVVAEAVQAGLLRSGDRVIITAGTPIGTRGTTNLIKAAT
ncbi:MAG: pyruvate kinase, partial [Deltaproteobacteria bacterium]|nr:pyruvate kinase [Deltaproteobacteria bacterium]